MPKPRIALALCALTLTTLPAIAEEPKREILVPAGWEGAYNFGYAPAIRVGDRVILSGIPNGGPGTYEERTRRMYERAKEVLAFAGATFDDVVEVMTFHRAPTDSPAFMQEFGQYMPIHQEFFGDHRPAWTAVGTSALLSGNADVEMRLEAVLGSGASSKVVYENPPATKDTD